MTKWQKWHVFLLMALLHSWLHLGIPVLVACFICIYKISCTGSWAVLLLTLRNTLTLYLFTYIQTVKTFLLAKIKIKIKNKNKNKASNSSWSLRILEHTWVYVNIVFQYCEADQYWYLQGKVEAQEIKQHTPEYTSSRSTAQDVTLSLGSGVRVLALTRNSLRIFTVTKF